MNIPKIPDNLKEWDIELLNEIIKYVDIESETFDFKKEPNELNEHICAMANTKGGFLVLGINEIKSNDGTKIIRFEKAGFPDGKQENIRTTVVNSAFNVEPTPSVEVENIPEEDGSKFYTIIKIESKNSDKPYFVKGTDQCFIRFQNSKRRANRSIILNLFSNMVEQKRNIERLRSSIILLKEEVLNTLDKLKAFSPNDQTRAALIDLSLVRNAIVLTEQFLTENNLLGRRTENTSERGITTAIHAIESLNTQITAYNTIPNSAYRGEIQMMIVGHGYVLQSEIQEALKIFDNIINKTDEFLKKFR